MAIRYASGAIVAAALACTAATAQAQNEVRTSTDTDTPITLVGCIQKESDYRRQNDSGRGGVAGTGLGRGNEYILINASRAEAGASAPVDCASTTGEAYELTGDREDELESFVGKPVQISGMLKKADLEKPVGTSGSPRPEGGFDPLDQDLEIFEVNVTSFSEVTPQSAALSIERAEPPIPEQQPREVGTSGIEQAPSAAASEELPSTASPLALTGLIGLLSLGTAFGLRQLRR